MLSTSGQSGNVVSAVKVARSLGIYTVGLCGNDGGKVAMLADTALTVNSSVTGRIQEAHILAGHILCHLVDHIVFQRHMSEE